MQLSATLVALSLALPSMVSADWGLYMVTCPMSGGGGEGQSETRYTAHTNKDDACTACEVQDFGIPDPDFDNSSEAGAPCDCSDVLTYDGDGSEYVLRNGDGDRIGYCEEDNNDEGTGSCSPGSTLVCMTQRVMTCYTEHCD